MAPDVARSKGSYCRRESRRACPEVDVFFPDVSAGSVRARMIRNAMHVIPISATMIDAAPDFATNALPPAIRYRFPQTAKSPSRVLTPAESRSAREQGDEMQCPRQPSHVSREQRRGIRVLARAIRSQENQAAEQKCYGLHLGLIPRSATPSHPTPSKPAAVAATPSSVHCQTGWRESRKRKPCTPRTAELTSGRSRR